MSDYTFSNTGLCESDSTEPFKLEGHLQTNIADNNWIKNENDQALSGGSMLATQNSLPYNDCKIACEEHTNFECLSINYRE